MGLWDGGTRHVGCHSIQLVLVVVWASQWLQMDRSRWRAGLGESPVRQAKQRPTHKREKAATTEMHLYSCSYAGDDQAEGFVVAVVPPTFNWGAFSDPEGQAIPAVLGTAPQLQQASEEGAGCGIASPLPSPSAIPAASASASPVQASPSSSAPVTLPSRLPGSTRDIQGAESDAAAHAAGTWALAGAALLAIAVALQA